MEEYNTQKFNVAHELERGYAKRTDCLRVPITGSQVDIDLYSNLQYTEPI